MRDGLGCGDTPALNYCLSDPYLLGKNLSVPLCKDLGNTFTSLSVGEGNGGGDDKVMI